MIRFYALLLLTCVIASEAIAQFNETIRTARPGQAIGAFTTGKGVFQVQSGFDYFNSKNSFADTENYGYLNNTVMRFGLMESFEISALLEYKSETVKQGDVETSLQGLSALDIGMRYHILTGKGLVPNVGFQIRMRLPAMGDDYEIKDMAPRFIIATSQKLSETFTLITNWGAAWNGNDGSPNGTYVINLSFPFTDNFGSYIETYGSLRQGIFTSNFDTGFAYLINNDLQLDLYGGYGSNHGIKDYFISMGISVRTKRND